MTGANPAVFELEGVEYPIKPKVYVFVQDYLHKKDNINWVDCDEPHIEYGVETNTGKEKRVRRQLNGILTNSKIGRKVVEAFGMTPINQGHAAD